MARPKNATPTYSRNRDSARCWVRGRWITLGKWNSPESKAEFSRVVAELAASPAANIAPAAGAITVNQLLAAFWKHAEEHYRHPNGTPTGELCWFRDAFRPVRKLYGHTLAANFGPLALKAVRLAMVEETLSRGVVNARTARIRRAFKWAASEQLIPFAAYQALTTVAGLQAGRTTARESAPVLPVDPAAVEATLPHLNRHHRAMVELQRVTGMRPAEVCTIRLADVNRTGELWVYRPLQHKTAHHGKERIVLIGPKGRAVIEAFIAGGTVVDPSAPLFSPRRAREERYTEMRAKRKTKVQPSQCDRRKASPKKLPALVYAVGAYAQAIRIAARRAGAESWCPNRLRHLFASEVRRDHGLEAAQVLLGHSRADVTQIYAERNLGLAASVAAKIG